jgi:hypothetical protein
VAGCADSGEAKARASATAAGNEKRICCYPVEPWQYKGGDRRHRVSNFTATDRSLKADNKTHDTGECFPAIVFPLRTAQKTFRN